MFTYKEVPMSNLWLGNMEDFLYWCNIEREKCIPTGICAQSISTTNGSIGFNNKYPTFEDAYEEYLKQFEGV